MTWEERKMPLLRHWTLSALRIPPVPSTARARPIWEMTIDSTDWWVRNHRQDRTQFDYELAITGIPTGPESEDRFASREETRAASAPASGSAPIAVSMRAHLDGPGRSRSGRPCAGSHPDQSRLRSKWILQWLGRRRARLSRQVDVCRCEVLMIVQHLNRDADVRR